MSVLLSVFSAQTIMSYFFLPSILSVPFSHLTALARTSSMIMKSIGEVRYSWLVSLIEKA